MDPDNPPWSEEMLGPAVLKRGRGPQKAPTKVLTTVRLDADVIAFFKSQGSGYQTRINDELRKVAMKGLATRLAKLRASASARHLEKLGGSEPKLKPVPRRRTAAA